jgi:hypothetical protein
VEYVRLHTYALFNFLQDLSCPLGVLKVIGGKYAKRRHLPFHFTSPSNKHVMRDGTERTTTFRETICSLQQR